MRPIIEVENLSKQYRLGTIGTGTVSHDLNRWWHRLRGKEDPYLKIGQANNRSEKSTSDYVWSLRDINFSVNQGEVLGVIGKNGAGKSTLLKILSKITAPTTGTIKMRGRVASLLEVGTGFHPELTGRENVFLNGAILGMTKKEIRSKFDEIVDFSGVEKYIDTPVKRYSSGMYVRLAFAVAAHLEPEILIVDEVLAVGDAEFQKKCLGKMKDVSVKDGRTVLFVSHNMLAVRELCKEVVWLKNGLVHDIGNSMDLIPRYLQNFSSEGLGEIKINSDYRNRRGTGEILFESIEGFDKEYDFDEPIIIKVKLNNPTSMKVIFKAYFKKSDTGELLFSHDFIDLTGMKELEISIPPRTILPGSYSTYIWLGKEGGDCFDLIDDVFQLRVQSRAFFRDLGFDPVSPGYYINAPIKYLKS